MRKLTTIFLLIVLGQCDYFSRLQIDHNLGHRANLAINSLLNTLDLTLDCNADA